MIKESNHYLQQTLEDLTKKDVAILQKVIRYHRELYTIQESAIISDSEYDQLFALLVRLEDKYDVREQESPTQRPESHLDAQFTKVTHKYLMKSL